jgi:hypothetical protein
VAVAEDLADLEAVLADDRVIPFPDKRPAGALVREKLMRFTGHVYMFPPGLQPDEEQPVEIYLNGIGPQFLGEDVRLASVGPKNLTVVVFDTFLSVEDTVSGRFVHLG